MAAPSNLRVVTCDVNRIALPPGRTWGQRWVASPGMSSVSAAGIPPAGGMRIRPLTVLGAAIIDPSSLQLAPRAEGSALNATGEPPTTDTSRKAPPLLNKIHWPFGEKEGWIAFSVLAR